MTGHDPLDSPALTVAVAALSGVSAQIAGRHTGLPGIVLLLGLGVAIGPDGLNVVRPESLGSSLQTLVGFAVAVILFEGALALNLQRLRRAQRPVQLLVTVGALVTLLLGTLVAKGATGWPWRICLLFGTLIIVTGPTVVTPLLRRLHVEPKVATVLEAEGVLIDAIGAVTAAVALEVALSPSQDTVAAAFVDLASRLGFGILAGLVGGGLLAALLRAERIVPEGLGNIFALTYVMALFQVTNAVFHESGIAAVTVAGIVLARTGVGMQHELHHFKEQLTSMLIGMLFILLAADVRLADVRALGWAGVATVVGVMTVVRPASVMISTAGSKLTMNQRIFMAWIGPRGIIAAAVASLFAVRLQHEGLSEGRALQAMVFGVIAVTVLWAGLTGGAVAEWLGLRRPKDTGWVIFGANQLALTLGRELREGAEVVFIESDPHLATEAEQDGFRTIFANPFEPRTLQRAQLESRTGVIALSRNEETNYLFAQRARKAGSLPIFVTMDKSSAGITPGMLDRIPAQVWGGAPIDAPKWALRVRQRQTGPERWRVSESTAKLTDQALTELTQEGHVLPLVVWRAGKVTPVGKDTDLKVGDRITLLVSPDSREDARAALQARAFERIA